MRRPKLPKRLPKPRIAVPDSVISWGLSLLTLTWGGFWVWFALMSAIGSESGAELVPFVLFATPVLVLSLLALLFPRRGVILMMPAAMFGAWFFDDAGARMLLATPALALGAALIWIGPWRRSITRLPRRLKRKAPPPTPKNNLA